MLRQKFRNVLVDRRLRARLSRFLNLVAFCSIIWILTGPWIARDVYSQETAMHVMGST